jgi:hypothetical protein
MERLPVDRSGVLILHLWIEANYQAGLRARITQKLDKGAERSIAVVASADDICAVIKDWVEAFADPARENVG